MKTVHELVLSNESFLVIENNNKYSIENKKSKKTIEITKLEYDLFGNGSVEDILDFYAISNEYIGLENNSQLSTIVIDINTTKQKSNISFAYTDTTTLFNACSIIYDKRFSPGNLFDLSTLIFLFVMYDKVVIDISEDLIPNEIRSIIYPLKLHDKKLFDKYYRYHLCKSIGSSMEKKKYLYNELNNNWSNFLGLKIIIDDRYIDSATISPAYNPFYIIGRHLNEYEAINFSQNYDERLETELKYDFSENVSLQTFRYFINEKISETLNCPYYCTNLRFPVEEISLKNKLNFKAMADKLLYNVVLNEPEELKKNDLESINLPEILLPIHLSIVLANSIKTSDIWTETLKLREKFKPIRKMINNSKNDRKELINLKNYINGNSILSKNASKADNILTLSSNIAGACPLFINQSLAFLKMSAIIKPFELATKIISAISRPEIRVIRLFKNEVEAINSSLDDVCRLWGLKDAGRSWLESLVKISEKNKTQSNRIFKMNL